ncbi:MAG: cold shock domain-containing protein [Actinobacteria bacterium]|nr:cold shock domain-containing protein [Actinomycetota bacterium]
MDAARRGTVTDFDREVGLGQVTDDDGRVWPFHCIAIADGTRDIATLTRVEFEVLPKLGRWEATSIRPA